MKGAFETHPLRQFIPKMIFLSKKKKTPNHAGLGGGLGGYGGGEGGSWTEKLLIVISTLLLRHCFECLCLKEKLKMVPVYRHAMLHEVADIISTSFLSTGSTLLKRYEKIRKPAVV